MPEPTKAELDAIDDRIDDLVSYHDVDADQIEAMQIYVRVAELASFTLAAQSLNLPKSSISICKTFETLLQYKKMK